MRGNKPNFSLGADKLDYSTINGERLQEPKNPEYRTKEDVLATALRQRQHNFQMSYHDRASQKARGFNVNVSLHPLTSIG